jgi:hypothetical protein
LYFCRYVEVAHEIPPILKALESETGIHFDKLTPEQIERYSSVYKEMSQVIIPVEASIALVINI